MGTGVKEISVATGIKLGSFQSIRGTVPLQKEQK